MILIQQNDASSPKVASVRAKYTKILGDKHEDAMAKFGAALSQGIIDAGGRNVTISMQNKSGSGNMPAIVGMALFQQFWYWFPLAHCLSLAFTPTAIIGINKDLEVRYSILPFVLDSSLTLRSSLRSPNSNSLATPNLHFTLILLRRNHQRRRLSKRSRLLFSRQL